jgi:hypothetical protein
MDLAWASGRERLQSPADDARERSVTLANRLLRVETNTLRLRADVARLQREIENGGGGGTAGGWFEPSRARFPWRRAEQPDVSATEFGPYDYRVDDKVVDEGCRGKAFMGRFGLEGDAPDFKAATDTLNAMDRRLDVRGKTGTAPPDVSIIIPIYGQLAYTLNCLESLFLQASKYSAEIIIIDDRSPDASGDHLPVVRDIRYHLQPRNGGFIKSCNTGGELARGRYVFMLNNDTRIVPGGLDALLTASSSFRARALSVQSSSTPMAACRKRAGSSGAAAIAGTTVATMTRTAPNTATRGRSTMSLAVRSVSRPPCGARSTASILSLRRPIARTPISACGLRPSATRSGCSRNPASCTTKARRRAPIPPRA